MATQWWQVPATLDQLIALIQQQGKQIAAVNNLLYQILTKEKAMADVLDSEVQAQAAMTTALGTLMTDVQTLIADFQNNPPPAGSILTSDPRWQTLSDAINQATSTVTNLDSSVKAALPPAPTP